MDLGDMGKACSSYCHTATMMKRLALSLLTAFTLHAQQRVEVSRDLWISAYSKEVEGNNGGSHRLKLKGIQEFFLIDFDPAALRGKKITKAQLHVHLTSPEAPLRRTTVSTISQDWVEGTGSSYARTPGASSFVWAKADIENLVLIAKDESAVLNPD